MKSRAVRIEREEINRLAGVDFDFCEIAELAEVTADYVGRFTDPSPPDFMLSSIELRTDPRVVERDARRAFVDAVEATWRERRRQNGYGSSYRDADEQHDGPLIRLIQYLLQGAGERRPPSNSTLHHDLVFLYTGRERAGRSSSTR